MLYYEYGSTSEKRRTDEVLDRWSHKQISDHHSDHTESGPDQDQGGHWAGGGRGVVLEAGGGVGVALPPPPPSPASFTWKYVHESGVEICVPHLFVVIIDVVARFEIAPPEIMSFSDVNRVTNIKSTNPILFVSLSKCRHPPEKSDKFSRRVRRLQQRPRPLQVLKHCPHNCRKFD